MKKRTKRFVTLSLLFGLVLIVAACAPVAPAAPSEVQALQEQVSALQTQVAPVQSDARSSDTTSVVATDDLQAGMVNLREQMNGLMQQDKPDSEALSQVQGQMQSVMTQMQGMMGAEMGPDAMNQTMDMMGEMTGMMGQMQGMMGAGISPATMNETMDMMDEMTGMMNQMQGMMGDDMGPDAMGQMMGMMGEMTGMMSQMQGMMGDDMGPDAMNEMMGMMGNLTGMMGQMQGMMGDDMGPDAMNQMMGMMGEMTGMMGQMQGMMGDDMDMDTMNQMMEMMGEMGGMMDGFQDMMGNGDSGTSMMDDGAKEPEASAPSPELSDLTRTAEAGSVTVDVTPTNFRDDAPATLDFEIALNTHSVELDADLAELAVLLVNGQEVSATNWQTPTAGGHHVSGVLSFPATGADGQPLLQDATSVSLVIRDLANVPERVFTWDMSGN